MQDETRQVEAALKAGIAKENIYGDKITGVSQYGDRPEYSKMVALLQPTDLVITEDLTRYGRSMVLMLVEINNLLEKGVQIKTLDGRLDTTTMPEEIVRLIVGVMGYAAEMELKNIKRRTAEGRAVAVSRGVKMGRKKTYDNYQIEEIKNMRASQRGYGSIAKSLGMSKSTIARLCRTEGI
jgi:DNA invertase Pin-like site-specific DNA recombinase